MLRNPYVWGAGGLIVGLTAGVFAASFFTAKNSGETSIVREGGYAFINPLISCNISEDAPSPGLSSLQHSLQNQIRSLIQAGDAERISIYVRDMDKGNWTGVGSNDLYAPASLMKVPLMMAYLLDARASTSVLSQQWKLSVPGDQNAQEFFKPSAPLTIGGTYSVQELLNAMIEQSDNNAMYALAENVSTTSLQTIYEASNIPPVVDENADSVSPQGYMAFFRVLYNATMVGRPQSQAALETLSQTSFTAGLIAGLPAGTPVSHKFGERTVENLNTTTDAATIEKRELHDCGIVYAPHHPYGICVMTQGKDFSKLANAIATLSQTTYNAVANGLLND